MSAPLPTIAQETANQQTNNQTTNNDDDPYFSTLNSIMRVTVAGFGGALAGLSFARRGAVGGAAAVSRQAAVSALTKTSQGVAKKGGGNKQRLQRQRPIIRSTPPSTSYVDRELPYAWAVACSTFAGIIEFTRVVSPTSFVWEQLMRGESKNDDNLQNNIMDKVETTSPLQSIESEDESRLLDNKESLDSSLTTISDHIIGGAIAGALFRGSAVRTQVGARIDASIMGLSTTPNLKAIKGKPLSGILPGAALGLMAGVAMVAMDRAQVAVEERFGHAGEEDEIVEMEKEDDNMAPIPDDIRNMSNEELMKSIEDLKKGKSEDSSNGDSETLPQSSGEEATIQKQTNKEKEVVVRDLISALGLRQHPSDVPGKRSTTKE